MHFSPLYRRHRVASTCRPTNIVAIWIAQLLVISSAYSEPPNTASSNAQEGGVTRAGSSGPDIITSDVLDCEQLGRVGPVGSGTIGMACGTWACNGGDQNQDWFALPDTRHPVITVNLFRLDTVDGATRFEQIGASWAKNVFATTDINGCGMSCQATGTLGSMGPGCADNYVAEQFAACDLGPRSSINPYTGVMPSGASAGSGGGCGTNYPARNHLGHFHSTISHRAQVKDADLMHVGARYFAEAHYTSTSEFTLGNGNQNNNASYREVYVSGPDTQGAFTFDNGIFTLQETPAIYAWSGTIRSLIDPVPMQDGQGILACKVTNVAPGRWHYEYAIQNMNLDRGIGSLSIPMPLGVSVTNVGFYALPHHPPETNAENYSNAPWVALRTSNALVWSTESVSANPLANAVRWGTVYNFRFDADSPPQTIDATVGFFKTGAPVQVAAQAPFENGFQDCNSNGLYDFCDVDCAFPGCNVPNCGHSQDCNHDYVPDECQGDCNNNGVPDVCETDCNNNFVADSCEIGSDTNLDCNLNGKLDQCDIASGLSADCNENGIPDECEAQDDCNQNGLQDICDIANGSSQDHDRNGVPDECQSAAPTTFFVDDDAPGDPAPGNSTVSDPLEDGSPGHPFDAIQEAINDSQSADTVLILDGTYTGFGNTLMDFGGRTITVKCLHGLGHCVIDLQESPATAFNFENGEPPEARLEGLQIINSSGASLGTPPFTGFPPPNAIRVATGSNPTMISCSIDSIHGTDSRFSPNSILFEFGGGAVLQNCRFTGGNMLITIRDGGNVSFNECVFDGTGLLATGSTVTIEDCDFAHGAIYAVLAPFSVSGVINSLNGSTMTIERTRVSAGRGCWIDATSRATLTNVLGENLSSAVESSGEVIVQSCTFVRGTYGTSHQSNNELIVANSIIYGNQFNLNIASPSVASITYSDIQGGWPGIGNIDADPLFVDFANGDYHLPSGSPCIDSGNTHITELPTTDLEGGPRVADDPATPDTGHGLIDMGAYEWSDCNGNNIDDGVDIANGLEADCDRSGVPDSCDLAAGSAPDCNANGIPDRCDLDSGFAVDCQNNGIPDSCDISSGVSLDIQPDSVPDECQSILAALPEPGTINKNRYISFVIDPATAGYPTALQVELRGLMHPVPKNLPQFPAPNLFAFERQVRYVAAPADCTESESPPAHFKCAKLRCAPFYLDWAAALGNSPLQVTGMEVMPSSTYAVRRVAYSCQGVESVCTAVSQPLILKTQRWGDVMAPFQDAHATAALTQPNISDVTAIIDKFKNSPTAPVVARGDLNPAVPDTVVNIAHVASVIDGFKAFAYAFADLTKCP